MSRQVRVFPARLDDFPRVAGFIAEVSSEAGFGREDSLRLTLIIEELFTNTCTHGPGDGAPVHLALDPAPGRIAVSYEDTGPPFDPVTLGAAPDVPANPEDGPPGGLGLVLIGRLGRDVQYSHQDGRNRFSLVVEVTR